MKNLPPEIRKIEKSAEKPLLVFAVIAAAVWFYIYSTTLYVTVRFDELGPVAKNMSTYYNGFKVGKVVSIKPDKDFKHMLARINLVYKNLRLPQNTTVKVQSFPNGELYLEFVYPQSPSLNVLKRGDVLEGIAKYSLEEFMLGQSVSGVSDIVSIHVIKALNAMDLANKEVEAFFKDSSQLMKDNKKEIDASFENIAAMTFSFSEMAENLNQASKKMNNALDEKELKKTTSNIKDTSENLAKATANIDQTMEKIDSTVSHLNLTSKNLASITGGLNETLAKKFGGMRIMFGTPVKSKNNVRNCCK